MKKGKLWSALTVVMGIVMVFYIAALALPHMSYNAAIRIPTGNGDETELKVEERDMSVLSFLAFPDSSKESAIKTEMKEQFDDTDYSINGVTTGLLVLIIVAVLGAVCAFLKSKKFIASFIPFLWGIGGFYVYFTNHYVQIGQADYWIQLALLAIAGVLALLLAIVRLPGVIAERKQIRMEIKITKERERGMIAKSNKVAE